MEKQTEKKKNTHTKKKTDKRKTGEGKRRNEFAEWHVAWFAE